MPIKRQFHRDIIYSYDITQLVNIVNVLRLVISWRKSAFILETPLLECLTLRPLYDDLRLISVSSFDVRAEAEGGGHVILAIA